MIKRYTITSTSWTPITTAGHSGACWVEKNLRGSGFVMITHSDDGNPKSYGFKISKPSFNNDVCRITADNENDIFYARVLKARNEINILVDVV